MYARVLHAGLHVRAMVAAAPGAHERLLSDLAIKTVPNLKPNLEPDLISSFVPDLVPGFR